jgi:hypothetical protein
MKTILHCPHASFWRVELDTDEVIPDNPGEGTPAMVYGPRGASATYSCASDTGEVLDNDCLSVAIPLDVQRWLESIETDVNTFLFPDETDQATPAGATGMLP